MDIGKHIHGYALNTEGALLLYTEPGERVLFMRDQALSQ